MITKKIDTLNKHLVVTNTVSQWPLRTGQSAKLNVREIFTHVIDCSARRIQPVGTCLRDLLLSL